MIDMFQPIRFRLACFFILTVMVPLFSGNDFGGGRGIPEDPYIIQNAEQLNNIRNYPTHYFEQKGNIDLQGYIEDNGWIPIGRGSVTEQFEGSYNGNGYVIKNFTVNEPDAVQIGLFSSLGSRAVLKNMILENVDMEGFRDVGALAGVSSGFILGCSAEGNIRGRENTGGLVGRLSHYETAIYHSFFEGHVSGEDNVGGLAGMIHMHSYIKNCYVQGSVSGSVSIGGLLGHLDGEKIFIYRSYAAAIVEGEHQTGGLAGWNEQEKAQIKDSYYDIDVSGQADTSKGLPRPSAEMKRKETFDGWDFDYFWSINDGKSYPYLSIRVPFDGGSGTAMDPFLVSDGKQLHHIRYHFASHFKQKNDIDLNENTDGGNWQPIPFFRGSYDGENHSIINLAINKPDKDYIGLFARIHAEAEVRCLLLKKVEITGCNGVGGLVAYNDGIIDHVFVQGNIKGANSVGGLAGYCHRGSRVSFGYVQATVNGDHYVGGIAGYSASYSILRCIYFQGDVRGEKAVGGVVGGSTAHSDIDYAIADGEVTGKESVGGLAGLSDDPFSRIYYSYSTSLVSGNKYVGGLVGKNEGTVSECYFAGEVSGNDFVGGIVGRNEHEHGNGFVERAYYDHIRTGTFDNSEGVPLSTEEMQDRISFRGWDFFTRWNIKEGQTYPFLNQVKGINTREEQFFEKIAPYFEKIPPLLNSKTK